MSGLRERIHRLRGAAPSAEPMKEISREFALPSDSRVVETAEGQFLLREHRYPLHYKHGIYKLGDLADSYDRLTRISRKFIRLKPVHTHLKLLFFDTETSGLGIGAGNLAFMLGIGYYTEDSFVVQQLFVRNPGEERAMLVYFAEFCSRFTHLVTYNGRSFDWPIVLNRFVLNRIPFDGSALEQLDLLYISRNLWKYSLESCRLSHVEEQRLGIIRRNDVSGALAPLIYFQFLSDGVIDRLEGVFQHNEWDVLTLSALAAHLGAILTGRANWPLLVTEDLYRIGAWLVNSGLPDLAESAFEELLRRPEAGKYCGMLASIYKKQHKYDKAVAYWTLATEGVGNNRLKSIDRQSLQPYIELAKFHEHHSHQLRIALHYTEEALNRLERKLSIQRKSDKEKQLAQELQQRRSRLLGKLYREVKQEVWQLEFE